MSNWTESKFITFDGLSLFYRYSKPQKPTQQTLLILHRGHEHSGRIVDIAEKLSQEQVWCFAFDLRGHGQSDGTRAWAPNFETWVKDLNSFAGHIYQEFGIKTKDMILIANSVGSVTAVSWILNYGPNVKGCILGAPAFSIKLYVPLALPSLRLLSKFSKHRFVTSYVKSALLTRDKVQAKSYDNDPLITKKIGVNILVTLFDTTQNCFNRLKDFETPVLILSAGNDVIVHNHFHKKFYQGISSSHKKHIELESFKHAIFHEIEQEKIIQPCQKFIQQLFNEETPNLPAVIPTARTHTMMEYQTLIKKPSLAKQFYYTCFRWLLTNVGKYAKGIETGLKYGFDSGVSLDYIYQNKPSGQSIFGKLMDKTYLSSVGWQGIRTRKKHLKQSLKNIIQKVHANGQKPIIFDIACGGARYLLEIQKESDFPIALHLNDIDPESLDIAKQTCTEMGLSEVSFYNKDIFSAETAWTFETAPNIIISSGVFELYENNQQVHHVINQIYKLLADNGTLIYTGQPWHPQLEMIARLLNNRQGNRWVMRRRTQIEMDQLIEASSFSKVGTLADDLGIFTVSFAQKIGDSNV